MPETTEYPPIVHLDRASVCLRIRQALRARSDRDWSVMGGRGTAWGWLRITAPPSRRGGASELSPISDEDQAELARLLDLPPDVVRAQGVSVGDTNDHYREFIDRAEGRTPRVRGVSYWE